MSSHLNWQNLRSWNGSQQTAFEELCCQLAAYEQVPQNSTFIRKGAPDAGVECFWSLPNGDELAWQAKFFDSVDKSQWEQLDKSVKTALEKHPRLISYTICLPLDRQDPRIDNQKWFMDKWNEQVDKWKGWAKEKGKNVNWLYWGEHEIFERLTREEHRGRYLFWFNRELFSQTWFQARLDEAVANAGARYSPELNVELLIARLFDGLGRTEAFFYRLKILQEKIKQLRSTTIHSQDEISAKAASEKLQEHINELLTILNQLDETSVSPIDFPHLAKLASESRNIAYDYIDGLKNIENEKNKVKANQKTEQATLSYSETYGFLRHQIYELIRELTSLTELVESSEANLANVSALLLLGKAGTGKTHLLCDVTQNRVKLGLSTVLLLGEQFTNQEPWSQIISFLKLSCTVEEFLGALEAAAEAKQSKALIFIDALNEGEGKKFWKKHFAGMLTTLSRFPRLGISVSVRTPYEDVVIPEHLKSDPSKLIREHHEGFAKHEYQATRTFFTHYNIKRPSVPLLNPEFQNPLFLKLFCLGLKNRNMTEVPPGFYGITSVFNFLIDSVNEKLSQEEFLNFDKQSEIVQKAMKKLAELMAKGNKQWLTREEAQEAVNAFLPREGYHNSLFRHLLVEGLLAEDRFYQGNDKWAEGIRFSYERFSDHLIVKYLLDEHLDISNPSQSFLLEQPLGELIKDSYNCWQNRSLIEALSIQIPERIQKELNEIAPHCANFSSIIDSFTESLIWREPTSITEATRQYINKYVIQNENNREQLLEAFLTLSTKAKHPYNADFLHQHLKKFEMAERDAWWSIFLHYQYGEHGAVDRLVEWAWSQEDKSHIDNESMRLCAIALAWFLTTSNRFLRDRATKALVALLTSRIHLLKQLIPQFLDVNDLYVLERLFAVAYGCAMRSTNSVAIAELAQNVYHWIFENGEPIPHILLRDYARGIIEVALHHNADLEIDVSRIKPPYSSEWLSYIPSEEDLEKYTAQSEKEQKRGLYLIEHSLSGWGDFARYVIGTNTWSSRSTQWSFRRLNEPVPPTRKEIYENFLESLTTQQKEALNKYQNIRKNVDFYHQLNTDKKREVFEEEFTEQELEEVLSKEEHNLRKKLGKQKTKIFEEFVIPYLNSPHEDEECFDLSIAQRWIFWKVLELGWTVERFGDFDSRVNDTDGRRESKKAERIGKKYQWLAYHEFLARLSDNFEFKVDRWNENDKSYQGTWQLSVRDIDPSCLLKATETKNWNNHSQSWWFPLKYEAWNATPNHIEWLHNKTDLPSVEPLIKVINPNNNSQWLVLENYDSWDEPTPVGEDPYNFPRRRIWYMIKSYIVSKEDIDCLYKWAIQEDFIGRWMPESHELYQIFLGEFFWSSAFEYYNIPYFHHDGWTQGYNSKIPRNILVSTDKYLKESSTFDCSVDDSYNIYLPCQWLVENMNLHWNGEERHFLNEEGDLIAFDPSVREAGSNACLIQYEALLSYLNKNDYDILWTLLGEKILLNGSPRHGRLELSGAFRIQNGNLIGKINDKQVL